MSDDLLLHYNRELLNIRRAAAVFAAENPRIAGRLRLSEDAVEDPHVGRLIEAFAYLTARVRQKLDDDFPELTGALLGILYPHFDKPIPSMSILQMEPQSDMPGSHLVPAGTLLDTEPMEGERCRFRTAFDVALHPVAVRTAILSGRPITAPDTPRGTSAAGCLRLTLEMTSADGTFARNAPERLRFFLRGQPQLAYPLYELLLNDTIAVAFAEGANDPNPIVLDASAFSPAGFDENEGLLPYENGSHLGFRILTEYFAFPEKFLFVDLALPERARLAGKGATLDVFVYLKRPSPNLERTVTAAAFALGCTPIVNLFPRRPSRSQSTIPRANIASCPTAVVRARLRSIVRSRSRLRMRTATAAKSCHFTASSTAWEIKAQSKTPSSRHGGWRAGGRRIRTIRAAKSIFRSSIQTSRRRRRPITSSRSKRFASIEIGRSACRSAAASRRCGSSIPCRWSRR